MKLAALRQFSAAQILSDLQVARPFDFAEGRLRHYSQTIRAVSSVVEHLVYTERVGGSKPSPPSCSIADPFDFAPLRSGQVFGSLVVRFADASIDSCLISG
jgi:hypothetical protein